MAERILTLEVFLALLLICREVDRDDLVRNPELLQNYGHALSASRLSKAIYLDDHYILCYDEGVLRVFGGAVL